MFCTNCGKSIDDDARFCTNCGHAVQSNAPAPEAPPAAPAPQNAAAPTPPLSPAPEQKKPGGRNKNTVLIIIIAILAALLVAVSVWLAIHLIFNSPSDNSDRDSHSEEVISDEDEDEDENEDEDEGKDKDTGGTSAPSGSEPVDRPAPGATESSGAASGPSEEVAMDTTIRIGVFEPLTGDYASFANAELLGIQCAYSESPTVTIDGIEYDIELIYADNGSDYNQAVATAEWLVEQDVSVVLGSASSALSMAASDVFAEAGVPAIGISCTSPSVTEGNDHYFCVCAQDYIQSIMMARFACTELGAETAFCLAQDGNDYSQILVDTFESFFDGVTTTYVFPEGTMDYSVVLLSALESGAEVIFAPVDMTTAPLLIEQATALGVDIPILGTDAWDSEIIPDVAQGGNIPIFITTAYQEGGNTSFDQTFQDFIDGRDAPTASSALGYDAYYVALEALKNAGSTYPDDVMDALWDTAWDGATGFITFDSTGAVYREGSYIKYCAPDTDGWELATYQWF